MNGRKILADTNILLYLLNGDNTVAEILQDKMIYISFITELELLGFSKITKKEETLIKKLIEDSRLIPLSNDIKDAFIHIRRHYRLKLADSIIAASSMISNIPLITADKQFNTVEELDVLIYEP